MMKHGDIMNKTIALLSKVSSAKVVYGVAPAFPSVETSDFGLITPASQDAALYEKLLLAINLLLAGSFNADLNEPAALLTY